MLCRADCQKMRFRSLLGLAVAGFFACLGGAGMVSGCARAPGPPAFDGGDPWANPMAEAEDCSRVAQERDCRPVVISTTVTSRTNRGTCRGTLERVDGGCVANEGSEHERDGGTRFIAGGTDFFVPCATVIFLCHSQVACRCR